MHYSRLLLTIFCFGLINTAAAGTHCLSISEGRTALLSESYEPYFSLLQPREMAAKLGHKIASTPLGAQQKQAKKEYAAAVLECTAAEEQALGHYVTLIQRATQTRYPGLTAAPWRFVKVADTLEGGLPHTRGDVTVISASLMKQIEATDTAQQWRVDLIGILIHEHVHVLQRHMDEQFASVYTQEWGFEKVAAVRGSEAWLAGHQIVNPDGVDVNWVWPVADSNRVIWPRVILEGASASPAMPDDFAYVGIELRRESDGYHVVTDAAGSPRYADLHGEKQFMKKFGTISSLYHPNEIAADMLTELAIFDCMIDKSKVPADVLASAESEMSVRRKWAERIVGQPPQ